MTWIKFNHRKYIEIKKDLIDVFNQLREVQEDLSLDAVSFEALEAYAFELEDILYAINRVIDNLSEVEDDH